MKKIIISLFIEFLTLFCFGQTSNNILYDTLLNANQGGGSRINYQVIRSTDLDEEGWQLDSSRLIIIFSDTNRATIRLPIPDEEVKNFAIVGVWNIHNGFALSTSYGGGVCIIQQTFKFKIAGDQIVLHKIVTSYTYDNSRALKKNVRRAHPKLIFSEIDLTTYLAS